MGSCLACVYQIMDARGKFGEHEQSVRVARGTAESNSSFKCSPNFPSASIIWYMHAKSRTNCFIALLNETYDEKAENPGENIRARECDAITVLNKIMDPRSHQWTLLCEFHGNVIIIIIIIIIIVVVVVMMMMMLLLCLVKIS